MKHARLGSLSVLLSAILAGACARHENVKVAADPPPPVWQAERRYPPLVFQSKATLDCSISATAEGRQIMTTTSGQGFSFMTPMRPIEDSLVKLQGKGMMYKFNAFPTRAFPAKFNGLGEGTVVAMKAEVEVQVDRYSQPGGPGTAITFNAEDISADAAYVEFTGIWIRTRDEKRFPFRVLFSSVTRGSGTVVPRSRESMTGVASKIVVLGPPPAPATVTTSLYEEEDDVAELPPVKR
jgi:hypothetical protein